MKDFASKSKQDVFIANFNANSDLLTLAINTT